MLKYIIILGVLIHQKTLRASVMDEDEDMFGDGGTTESNAEEEWHMDFMPTGYLPDSVYRELAWYGILQIQPLPYSNKLRYAAKLIWEHTLGRPHVIMENPPQQSGITHTKASRQMIAEEAAKWSREQRGFQEILMENIKTGGNGITVRTVKGSSIRTIYIIKNGNYFVCPEDSVPDMETMGNQLNLHSIRCTKGREPVPVAVDPCIEAEVAPIEYSFHEGWMFCLGPADRENIYFNNGTLDCGHKVKVPLEKFLEMCAIDNNIVISYEYYGDEPRKDLVNNVTLCSAWDPCHLSYLYRLEPPPADRTPHFPTSSENPCETTVCLDCLENATEDGGEVIDILDDEDNLR